MSKTVIWSIVGVVVVVGGYFAFSGSKSDSEVAKTDAVEKTTAVTKTETAGKKMAFADFVKNDGTYKCTVSQNVSGVVSTGVVYMSGGMVSGLFNTKVQGMSIDSHFIMRDGYSYSWSSAAPTMGFKSKVNTTTGTTASGSNAGQYSFNSEQVGEYDCQPWTVDQTKFTIPTSVTFTDYSTKY